jgi:hypothetical protein
MPRGILLVTLDGFLGLVRIAWALDVVKPPRINGEIMQWLVRRVPCSITIERLR